MSSGPVPSIIGSDGATSTGRGNGGGRGRGRNRFRGRGQGQGAVRATRSKFRGDTEEMNGNVFECFDEQADRRQYAKTMEALEGYAKKHLRFPDDLSSIFADTMSTPTLLEPNDPITPATRTSEMIWAEEVKEYVKRVRELRSSLATLHAVIWGQCSEAMKAKIKSHEDYCSRTEANDCVWILKQVKAVTQQFDSKRNGFISLLDARTRFLTCKQGNSQTCNEYLDTLKGWADTIEYYGGTVAENHGLVSDDEADGTPRTEAQKRTIARDRTLAIALLRGADPSRYGTLVTELANQYAMGVDNYPDNLTAAYGLLVSYKTPANQRTNRLPGPSEDSQDLSSGMTFAQRAAGTGTPGRDGQLHAGITCYNCQACGHYASECPTVDSGTTATTTGTTLVQLAYMLAQAGKAGIDPNWILLDSQSTVSVFKNRQMLSNIRCSGHTLRAMTNGGHQDSNMIGDFPNLGPVWYNPASIANILSLADVRKVCRVTMDTDEATALFVHRIDGSTMRFQEHSSGLYVFDATSGKEVSDSVNAYSMLQTVAEQKRLFSRREVDAADVARALYRKIGRPGKEAFEQILRRNLIRNCPVTPDDAKRAILIYGPDVATLKGKMTRRAAAARVPTYMAVPLPPPIEEHHRDVTLCIDFLFVQGIGFFHTISRGIGFRTVSAVPNRSKATILREVRTCQNLYEVRGLRVRDIHADNEFECIRENMRPVELNIVPADSHVGEIERSNRTMKEHLRTTVHGLPFRRLPRRMIVALMSDAARCLNQFPWANGISDTLSPATIVTGRPAPDYNAMRIEFGAYAQVFEDHTPTNTPRSRTLGAIALNPTGNAQGDYYFLSLATGDRISRHQWVELPIPPSAIARVEQLALDEGQPLLQEHGLVIEWRPDHAIDDDEYDADFYPPPDDTADDSDSLLLDDLDPTELADLAHEPTDFIPADPAFFPPAVQGAPEDDLFDPENETENETIEQEVATIDQEPGAPEEAAPADEQELGAPEGAALANEQLEEEEPGAPETGAAVEQLEAPGAQETKRYNLRTRPSTAQTLAKAMDNPHSSKSYFPPTTLLQQKDNANERTPMTLEEQKKFAFGFIMTQMTAKAGIKKHGVAAEEALLREFMQLEDQTVYEPIHPSSLTAEQRKGTLRAINLIKEKRDGNLKGRTVADGSVQRGLYDKSETTSPTVSNDALMISVIVDAYERRDVAVADVAGAYLKAYMEDFVTMKFTGPSVDILCEMKPEYNEYVVTESGIRVLYVRLIKALYGCVKSALLWYDLFAGSLEGMGFVLNPYDLCVANSMIEGKQCTIAWYVDDTKISHISPAVVTNVIEKIEEKFGKMTVSRGTKHTFLGIDIEYKENGTAILQMRRYLEDAIMESEMAIKRSVATPAKKNLFDVSLTAPLLIKTEAEVFHKVVAKLLYVSMRARMDILLPVIFLCTRVSFCTVEDKEKLKRVLEYLSGTLDLTYTLGADDLKSLRTWVDVAYAVHPDMRSHTGGAMSFGTGALVCKSGKQRLNTKSSTESEMVGASDYLPNTIWVKMFLDAQGHRLEQNFFEQDNQSAIRLETNGKMSAGQKSRHINVRYFWIKDRIKSEKITIRYCPTLEMVGDFFTKPLQGNLFRKFRDVILGYKHVSSLATYLPTPDEERVGRRGNEQKEDRSVDGQATASAQGRISSDRAKSTSAVCGRLATGKAVGGNPSRGVTWAQVVSGGSNVTATK